MKRTKRVTSRRGVAMLLVLVATVIAVVLTSAAIVSRETAPAMGANAASSVEAGWGAESAANYAIGVVAQGFDWAGAMGVDGTLVESMVVGDATVHVKLMDMEGNVPDVEDRDLMMIATATVNGMTTTVQRRLSLGEPGDPIDAIDLLFGEFTLLGVSDLALSSGTRLGVWPMSPEAVTCPQVKLGTAFASGGNLSVDIGGATGPVEMHADITGDAGLVSEISGTGYTFQWQMPVDLPIVYDTAPSGVTGALTARGDYQPANGAVATMPGGAYGQVQIQNSAAITIDGTTPTAVRCDRLIMQGASLRIVGDVGLMVRDRLRLDSGARIVMADENARLTVYIGNEFELDGSSQFGVASEDAGRGADQLTRRIDPAMVRIVELNGSQGGSGAVTMNVLNGSTVLAAVHAPGASLEVQAGSTLIGRATADTIRFDGGSTMWYDPTLDNRVGFTNPDGPLYEADRTLDPVVEEALSDPAVTGATTITSLGTVLRTTYDTLEAAVVEGDGLLESTGGTISKIVPVFNPFPGLF